MLNILIILGVTCVLFLTYQAIGYALTKICFKKLNQKSTKVEETPLVTSVTFLVVFLVILMAVISWISSKTSLSTSEHYLSLSSIGICSIIWCYYESNLLQGMLVNDKKNIKDRKAFTSIIFPRLSSKKVLARKKAFVFSFVFVFAFVFGYRQVLNTLDVQKIDTVYVITNTSIVAVMIAFDRVLSQLHTLYFKENE